MKTCLVMLAAVAIAGLSATSLSAQPPDPNQVFIESISYGGTGCPQGTVGQSISDDRQSFTLIFDNFVASSGPGVPITESRKNCQLTLNLHVPQGAGNTVVNVTYRGYTQLAASGQAAQSATYYVAATDDQKQDGVTFSGPLAQDYTQADSAPLHLQKADIQGCRSVVPLNINSQVQIDSGLSLPQQITTDSINGSIQQTGQTKKVTGC